MAIGAALTEDTTRVFRQSAVTSGISIVTDAVDLKTAACFYDKVVIMDYEDFEPRLSSLLGPDLDYLVDENIISVEPYDEQLKIKSNHKAYQYADAIRSHMASSLFTPADQVSQIYEVAGNGMTRLFAAMAADAIGTQNVVPIVSGRTKLDGYGESINLERNPMPSGAEIEGLLPVRTTATEALFNLIPVPNRQVPWQDVLEFRAEQKTGLYATRIRILLERLGKETDRRHAEDLVRSEFASFEAKLRIFKKQTKVTTFKAWLPWGDFLHNLLKGVIQLKPSEAAKSFIETAEHRIEISKAEEELTSDPYYMIEHVRSAMA